MKDISALTGTVAAKPGGGKPSASGTDEGGGGPFAALFNLIGGGKDKLLRATAMPGAGAQTGKSDGAAAVSALSAGAKATLAEGEAAELAGAGVQGDADASKTTKKAGGTGKQAQGEDVVKAAKTGETLPVQGGAGDAGKTDGTTKLDPAVVTAAKPKDGAAKAAQGKAEEHEVVAAAAAGKMAAGEETSAASSGHKAHKDADVKNVHHKGMKDKEKNKGVESDVAQDQAASLPAQAAAQMTPAPVPAQPRSAGKANSSGPAAIALEGGGNGKAAAEPAAAATRNEQEEPEANLNGRSDQGQDHAIATARTAAAQDRGLAETAPGLAMVKKAALKSAQKDVSLNDIVQSLPPGIQMQLGTQGAASSPSHAAAINASLAAPSASAQLSSHVIDMGVSGQWIDRMAKEIATLASGSGHSRFQLSPPNLGRVQVDLWQGGANMNVRLLTETDEAARRLRDGKDSLQSHAQVASLQLGSVTVEKSTGHFDSGRDQNANQNQRQMADLGGQAQQQSGGQAQGQPDRARNMLNESAFPAVIGADQRAEPTPAAQASPADGRRVRYA